MNIEPLNSEIIKIAKLLGISVITLEFSGGSDEGYLSVEISPWPKSKAGKDAAAALVNTIEKWAWDAYDYNGAGDGQDYGDNIVYEIFADKVRATHNEWYMVQKEGDPTSQTFSIDEKGDSDELETPTEDISEPFSMKNLDPWREMP